MPVGIAGPLRVDGAHARGDYYLPLATTEATLVASYSRGCGTLTDAGGCRALVLADGVSRTPGFVFDTAADAADFAAWTAQSMPALQEIAASTSRYGRLVDLQLTQDANQVYVGLDFTTGDAAGQNIATIAAEAVCGYLSTRGPRRPRRWFVEANMSGDKKATTGAFMGVRGKRVTAEAILPADMIARRLHTTADAMASYAQLSLLGGVMSGSIGAQGHYANGLAALFIACGQDAASVAEAAVGVTRFERREDGSLYASVTLPNLIVGTVGGGTALPTQHACLEILGLAGAGHASAFAEVAAALALAGEISIVGALAAGEFARAHRTFARQSAGAATCAAG